MEGHHLYPSVIISDSSLRLPILISQKQAGNCVGHHHRHGDTEAVSGICCRNSFVKIKMKNKRLNAEVDFSPDYRRTKEGYNNIFQIVFALPCNSKHLGCRPNHTNNESRIHHATHMCRTVFTAGRPVSEEGKAAVEFLPA